MTAQRKLPGTYTVTESDPAWDALVSECKSIGVVIIQGADGQPYRLLADQPTMSAKQTVTDLPDFDARLRKLWPDGPVLNEAEAAHLDKLIAGE